MTAPNPLMLKWAREQAGLSIEEASKKLSLGASSVRASHILEMYENGVKIPSTKKLYDFSKVYHRPLIFFYLPEPPKKADRGEDFRTLTDSLESNENRLLDTLVRDIYVKQSIVKQALIDSDDAKELDFIGSLSLNEDILTSCNLIKNTTGINDEEYRACKDGHASFNYLRKKMEDIGIFVILAGNLGSHHSNIDVNVFRGFVISDKLAPFIVINDNDSKYAWCFTLLHELVHIFINKTGISNNTTDNEIEKYCNEVASYLIVSKEKISSIEIPESMDELLNIVSKYSSKLNVSCSLIAYRLLLNEKISTDQWQVISKHFRDIWLENKNHFKENKKLGGSYYVTRRHKIGNYLLDVVKKSVLDGVMTETKAGKVLGVQAGNVAELVGL